MENLDIGFIAVVPSHYLINIEVLQDKKDPKKKKRAALLLTSADLLFGRMNKYVLELAEQVLSILHCQSMNFTALSNNV